MASDAFQRLTDAQKRQAIDYLLDQDKQCERMVFPCLDLRTLRSMEEFSWPWRKGETLTVTITRDDLPEGVSRLPKQVKPAPFKKKYAGDNHPLNKLARGEKL